jgi:hypothetical protein
MPQTFVHDPNAVLDYKFDWANTTNGGTEADWLEDGETIATHTVTATTGITVDDSDITDDGTSVTVWLSGGTAGESYRVTCAIVTSASRADDRTITLRVRER